MGPIDEPSWSAGNQLPWGIAPAIPPWGTRRVAGLVVPFIARSGARSTLMYHLLWLAHHEGVTNRVLPSGKSISRPPGADVSTMRPPPPRSSPVGLSVVRTPSTRSWRPLG